MKRLPREDRRARLRRRLRVEQLEHRALLAALQAATMQSIAQPICDPESDTNHSAFVDSIEAAAQTRHFTIVLYDTQHPDGTTFDRGALFGTGECAVVPGDPVDPETPLTAFRSTDIQLSIERVDVPASEVEQMAVVIDDQPEFLTDRLAFSRHIEVRPDNTADERQFLVLSADAFLRPNTLPNSVVDGVLLDDNFGLSVGLATTPESRPTGEVRRLGQIERATIQTRTGLPHIELAFEGGGTATLDVSKVTAKETRIEVAANYPHAERLVVIGSNPLTQDMRQRDDTISDYDTVLLETIGPEGRLFAAEAEQLGGSLSTVPHVVRAAFTQAVKSQHNPRDGSLVILLGEDIPSDGFGDTRLVEAEAGNHSSTNPIVRPTASHSDGEFPSETSVLLMNAELTGTIAGAAAGNNIAFVRHSLDDPIDSFAALTINDEITQTLNLESTQLPGLGVAEAWNFHKTSFSGEFETDTETIDYLLQSPLGEFDTVGTIHLGGEIGSSRFDVDGSGLETALDALLIINFMGRNGGTVDPAPLGSRLNVTTSDTAISALDALQVINFLGRSLLGQSESVPIDRTIIAGVSRLGSGNESTKDDQPWITPEAFPTPAASKESTSESVASLFDRAIVELAGTVQEEESNSSGEEALDGVLESGLSFGNV